MYFKVFALVLLSTSSVLSASPGTVEHVFCNLMQSMSTSDESWNLCKQRVDDFNFTFNGSVFGETVEAVMTFNDVSNHFCEPINKCGLLVIEKYADYDNGTMYLKLNLTNIASIQGHLNMNTSFFSMNFGDANLAAQTSTIIELVITVGTSCSHKVNTIKVDTISVVEINSDKKILPNFEKYIKTNDILKSSLSQQYEIGLKHVIEAMDLCKRLTGWFK